MRIKQSMQMKDIKKMNNRKFLLLLAIMLVNIVATAQTGSGSMTVDNSAVVIAPGATEQRFAESVYFGPNADWTVNGILEIYSRNVWIAPGAKFAGSGKIVIYGPGKNPYYPQMGEGATSIDGNNGSFINLLLEHRNTDNVILADITDPGYGTANPAGANSASLNIGTTLDMAADGADIILNGHNLVFGPDGLITNYTKNRMVVTGNSIAGHMVKDYAGTGTFVFPIGISEGDYTPATISPATAGRVFASVQDYAGAGKPLANTALGMDRTWNIYAATPVVANMVLQHNPSTNGNLFRDANAAIARYAGGNKWNYLKGVNPSVGVHAFNGLELSANLSDNGAYYTKLAVSGSTLFIPNLFTPNGDGNNDTFEIRGLELFAENDLVIVNRWGNEVFRAENYRNTWTGEGLNEGTYYYVLRIKDGISGEWQVFKGYLTLIRAFKK